MGSTPGSSHSSISSKTDLSGEPLTGNLQPDLAATSEIDEAAVNLPEVKVSDLLFTFWTQGRDSSFSSPGTLGVRIRWLERKFFILFSREKKISR
jgi:hypothetical protein